MAHLDSSGIPPNTNAHGLATSFGSSHFIRSSSFVTIKPLKSLLSSHSLSSPNSQQPYCFHSRNLQRRAIWNLLPSQNRLNFSPV